MSHDEEMDELLEMVEALEQAVDVLTELVLKAEADGLNPQITESARAFLGIVTHYLAMLDGSAELTEEFFDLDTVVLVERITKEISGLLDAMK